MKKSSAHVWKTGQTSAKKNCNHLKVCQSGKESKADISQIAKLTVRFLLEKSSAHVWKTGQTSAKKADISQIAKLTVRFLLKKSNAHA